MQFPVNPTTSIVDPDNASLVNSQNGKTNSGDAAASGGEGRRATSPLTQDAVSALPVDPAEARRQRVREQQQRRAAAAAQADKSVGLYAITAAPPKPQTATMSGGEATRRSKERSRSQPTPTLPKTILEPKQVFPVPPPLVLHTIDEDEPAATAAQDGAAPHDSDYEAEVVAPAKRSPLFGVQLDDCEASEGEARGVLDAVEQHERAKLRQAMEEAETTIHARRGLEGEFEATPLPSQPGAAVPELSDQVSATSDDELSQRSSAHKFGSTGGSRRKHRTPRSSVAESDEASAAAAEGAAANTVSGNTAQKGQIESHLEAETPANASSAAKSVGGTASAVDTPSPMTAARSSRHSEAKEEKVDRAAKQQAFAERRKRDEEERDAAAMQESRSRGFVEREAAEEWQQIAQHHAYALRQLQRARELREGEQQEEERLFAQQRDRLFRLEQRSRDELASDAVEERRLLQQQQERAMQHLRRTRALREQETQAELRLRQQQQQERTLQQEERNTLARRALEDRESLEREALCQTESAVRAHYEQNDREWQTTLVSHALETQRHASAAADAARQQQQQQQEEDRVQCEAKESAARTSVVGEEADEWSWLLSGARVDRVLAATEEGDRVQREYEELRRHRLLREFQEDAAALVAEELHRRRAFEEYEATTRSMLQSQCRVQHDAAAAEEARLRKESAQKAAARREMALQQQWQRERDEVDADEAEGRAVVREEEREERRTASVVFVQSVAAVRRRGLLARLASSTQHRAEEEAEEKSAQQETASEAAEVAADLPANAATTAAAAAADTSHVLADPLEELRSRQQRYEEEMRAAMQRLQEAERRVTEEAAIRARAEDERRASQAESERLLREAEQRAEQRIRDARDAAERLMQTQLAEVRDEAARRAEHAAVMQSLAEEEQRAVLEAKLQAAERQLQQAEQRAQEEVQRTRDEAAAMAAAEAARAAQEAQRREEAWQEHVRAERLLRLAEQESEKEAALRRLSELEARAAEAMRLAREEAASHAAAMEARMAEMERRQQAREAELQEASQRVRHARDSVRDFDSRSQSSLHTTPSRGAEWRSSHSPQQQQQQQRAGLTPTSMLMSVSPVSRHSVQTPPLAPSPSQSPASALSAAAVPSASCASIPPRVTLSAEAARSSLACAAPSSQSRPPQPLSSAASASGAAGGAVAFDPADVVRAAIREAVLEIVAAQQRAQSFRDQAEQCVELSERRYQRKRGDQLQAANKVAELESSHAQSELSESPHYDVHLRQPLSASQRARGDRVVEASRVSDSTPSPSSGGVRGSHHHKESPLMRSSASSPGAVGAAAVPVPSVTAAVPGCVTSNTMSNTSSVYFDDQPYWTAGGGRMNATAAALQPRSVASRVLFPKHRSHSSGVGGHAYNEPEPSKPTSIAVGSSPPPPRRSTTRAAAESEPLLPAEKAPAVVTAATRTTTPALPIAAMYTTGVLPQPSRVCPRCYSAETTSPCWRCGEIICRHCGLQPGSVRKLCCSAHLREQLRMYTRNQHQQGHQQPLREDQQVQTSFRSSTHVSEDDGHRGDDNAEDHRSPGELCAGTADRPGAGASIPVPQQPPTSMIPPSAYYFSAPPPPPPVVVPPLPPPQQQQQQQQQYYFDRPGMYANPVSVAAMTASEPVVYPPVYPHLPYAYSTAYPPYPVQPLQQQQPWAWPPPSTLAQQQQQYSLQPQQQAPQSPSRPAVDVTVEGDGGSHIASAPQERQRASNSSRSSSSSTTSSSSSQRSVVACVSPRPQEAEEVGLAAGSRSSSAANSKHNRLAQPPKSVQLTTPVKEKTTHVEAGQRSSTPNEPAAASQEPKTVRKKAASAFFVPLDDGSEEPRRPKPPTPCNYVPNKLFPPDAVRAAAAAAAMGARKMKQARRPSQSPPQRAQAARPVLHDPYAARGHNARPSRICGYSGNNNDTAAPQRRQRKSSTSPHAQPVVASYMKVVAPMHPRFVKERKASPEAATVARAPAAAQLQRRSQSSSDSYSPYTTSSSSSTYQPQVLKRPQRDAPVSQRTLKDDGNAMRDTNTRQHPYNDAEKEAAHRRCGQPMPRQRLTPEAAAKYVPQRPQLQPSQKPLADPQHSYYSYSSLSTATSETQALPQGRRYEEETVESSPQQHQHRYAPHWAEPSSAPLNSKNRRVPTLAELDRRLQELRAQDEYEAVQYQQRQSRLWRTASPVGQLSQQLQRHQQWNYAAAQPQVHVLLQAPGGGGGGGGASPRHSHRSRSSQQRTVSPPWRTDLNSSPLRPRWDISQPHSLVYSPSSAAAAAAAAAH